MSVKHNRVKPLRSRIPAPPKHTTFLVLCGLFKFLYPQPRKWRPSRRWGWGVGMRQGVGVDFCQSLADLRNAKFYHNFPFSQWIPSYTWYTGTNISLPLYVKTKHRANDVSPPWHSITSLRRKLENVTTTLQVPGPRWITQATARSGS